MAHLSPGTFIDLLDGTIAEAAVPHLATCAGCRQQISELRATWQATADVQMPEPSPLFWDHLSARVRDAVAVEAARPVPWWRFEWSWRVTGLVTAAAAAVVVSVAIQLPRGDSLPVSPATPAGAAAVTDRGNAPAADPLTDDASLGFVADLASNIDWDNATEFGLASHGDADRALADMNDGERLELRRLLNEALGAAAGQHDAAGKT